MSRSALVTWSLLSLVACDGDGSPADTNGDATTATATGATDATGGDVAATDTAVTDATAAVDTAVGVDTSLPETGAEVTAADVLVPCHDLDYAVTCDKPAADGNGYFACSDYFGVTLGVVAQCSAGPSVDVREGGPPCAAYEHYVGSCVYFLDTPNTDDRCYVTHVGAVSADKIEAGRAFWRVACPNGWRETLE